MNKKNAPYSGARRKANMQVAGLGSWLREKAGMQTPSEKARSGATEIKTRPRPGEAPSAARNRSEVRKAIGDDAANPRKRGR